MAIVDFLPKSYLNFPFFSPQTDDIVTSTADDAEDKSVNTAADWHQSRSPSLMSMESKILSAEKVMKKIEVLVIYSLG